MKMKLLTILVLFLFSSVSHAWSEHQRIMETLIASPAAHSRVYLSQKIKIPCLEEEQKTIQRLGAELFINAAKVPLFSKTAQAEDCSKRVTVKLIDLLQSNFIDEPDFGMDQDLPESADPHHDRDWMGGKTGPTSQGFRHMYFPGIKWGSPLQTLQLPLHAVGQAPDRFNQLKKISDQFFKEGDLFWGTRTLLWALHIMQDLHQPFHTTQILSLKLIPFRELFHHFVARTTQAIANYHYAYEGLLLEVVNEGDLNGFSECLNLDVASAAVDDIQSVIRFSNSKGTELGKDLFELFPQSLKSKSFDLTRAENPSAIDYYALLNALEEKEELKRTIAVSCTLMKHLTVLTWGEFDRAFHFQ